jgi:hypothetical protein
MAHKREGEMLFYSLSGARIFFANRNKDLDKGEGGGGGGGGEGGDGGEVGGGEQQQ